MIIPKFHPTTRSNVPEAPRWIDEFIRPLNEQIKTLTDAMQKQISFGENLNAEVKDLEVMHDVWYDLTLQKVHGKPIGVFLIYWADESRSCSLFWKIKDLDVISLKAVFGGVAPTTPIVIRFIVLGK